MGAHRWRGRGDRRVAGRLLPVAAAGAALVAVAGSVLVGIGTADETPDLTDAPPVSAVEPAAALPALPTVPEVEPARRPAPTPDPDAAAERDRSAPAPVEREDEPAARDQAQAEEFAVPTQVSARAPAKQISGTPCTATARSCVDLTQGTAWLIDDGRVKRGPVDVMIGASDDPTPVGTFKVQWKDKEHTSRESLIQMPYSVFFADGGIAFHEGEQDTNSSGCVKLTHDDAVAWFNFLQVGDEVQVVRTAGA